MSSALKFTTDGLEDEEHQTIIYSIDRIKAAKKAIESKKSQGRLSKVEHQQLPEANAELLRCISEWSTRPLPVNVMEAQPHLSEKSRINVRKAYLLLEDGSGVKYGSA
jgi:hypothetical protein